MLHWCDSFDHYATADRGEKYDTIGTGGINASGGRFGGAWEGTNQGHYLRRALGVNAATMISGVAFKLTDSGANQGSVLSFFDATSEQVSVRILSGTKTLIVSRAGTTLETGTAVLADNTWYYIEFKAVIANSGSWEVRINGVLEMDGTGDTQATANAYANAIQIGGPSTSASNFGQTWNWDDLYVCDDTDSGVVGAPNDDFLGDVRVQAIFPNANGTTSDFDGSDGNQVDNYLLVDETAPDDDSTYTQSATLNEKDTYNYGSVTPTVGSVYGVMALPHARKLDAGSRSVCAIARSGSTEEDGADKSLSTSYLYYPQVFEADPDTGDAWDLAGVNAAQFGLKVTV